MFHACQGHATPAITVRGICDYADKNKSKLESQTHGHARFVAADNVMTFLQLQLTNPQFLRFLTGRKQQKIGTSGELACTKKIFDRSAAKDIRYNS